MGCSKLALMAAVMAPVFTASLSLLLARACSIGLGATSFCPLAGMQGASIACSCLAFVSLSVVAT